MFNAGVKEDVYLGGEFIIGRPEDEENRNSGEGLESQAYITIIDFNPSYR